MTTDGLVIAPQRLGWVAGLVEGEGWIGVRKGRPHVQVASTDLDVVERLRDWSTVGYVFGPTVLPNRKPYWRWAVTKRDDAAALLTALVPLLCARRAEKARQVLEQWDEHGPTRGTADVCGRGHDLTDPTNLRIVQDGKYRKRRCLKCVARRQREHRARVKARAL